MRSLYTIFTDYFIRVYFIRYSDCTIKVYQSLCINFSLGTDSFLLAFVHDKCHILGLSGMVFTMDGWYIIQGRETSIRPVALMSFTSIGCI